jgi:DNA-binding NarL/FixJ family response regulator
VASLVSRALTNRQIAKELVISEGSVGKHVANLLKNLNLPSHVQGDSPQARERAGLK